MALAVACPSGGELDADVVRRESAFYRRIIANVDCLAGIKQQLWFCARHFCALQSPDAVIHGLERSRAAGARSQAQHQAAAVSIRGRDLDRVNCLRSIGSLGINVLLGFEKSLPAILAPLIDVGGIVVATADPDAGLNGQEFPVPVKSNRIDEPQAASDASVRTTQVRERILQLANECGFVLSGSEADQAPLQIGRAH